jgi:transforming growth factor-beta-induced protein
MKHLLPIASPFAGSFSSARFAAFAMAPMIALAIGCGSSSSTASGTTGATTGGDAGVAQETGTTAADIVDTAVAAGKFTKLAAALKAAGLVDTLKGPGPFTVFAPTDDAFAKLPAGTLDTLLMPANQAELQAVLKFHVVSGEAKAADVEQLIAVKTLFGKDVKIAVSSGVVQLTDGAGNTVNVTTADVIASNGVIHVIDGVLLPPTPSKDIVDTAVAAGKFTKLAAALNAAGLVSTLKGAGPFTVFAPTDDAFAKIPADQLTALLDPANKAELTSILTYHVSSGALEASDVAKVTSAPTVNGKPVTVSASGGTVTLNGSSKVIAYDVEATNGVIHVIDTVLTPPK